MLNSSFTSETHSKNLSKLERSIINEYKRLNFGEQSIQYSVSSIHFENLPQNFPEEILQGGRRCFRLSGCSFFEMLTYSVWEFLLSNRANEKTDVIKKIRKQIAVKDFMEDCPSTKGLLLKGIKQMYDYVELARNEKLIAHCMWKTDSMQAFSEFWKNLLAKLSVRNVVIADTTRDLQVKLFQLLADFLQINFCIYYEGLTEFQKQVYLSQRKKTTLRLDIIIYSGEGQKRDCSKVLDSSVVMDKSQASQVSCWNYIVLEDTAEYYRSQLEREDISEIKVVDESLQEGPHDENDLIRLLKLKTRSEINLQKPSNLQFNPQEYLISPMSEVKSAKENNCLETTRTRKSGCGLKSGIQTNHHTNSDIKRQRFLPIEGISMEQTKACLNTIRMTTHQGEELIREMRAFCERIGT